MKAIRVHEFGAPEVMKYEETPDLKPQPGQVLVEIKATGVNPVEAYIRSGSYARKPNLPYTPGGDGAGVVLETGKGVSSYQAGDRVYTYGSLSGTYAEAALCLETRVYKLPAKISFSQGAALGVPYGTAYRALFQKACAKPGETVFVHGGSGGVGIAAIQLANQAGCQVFATAGTPKGRRLVAEQGAAEALDHTSADLYEKLMRLTNGRGADVILEMLANVNLAEDLTVLAPRGRIVVIGSRGTIEIDPRQLMMRDALVMGMTLFNTTEGELAAIHASLAEGLSSGALSPVIGREFPLQDAAQAHKAVMQPGASGKIVLVP
jgi:NADPH2:quinone reductase